MKQYLAVLGRQPEISLAELESLFENVYRLSPDLALFESEIPPDIRRLGGSMKLAERLEIPPLDYLRTLDDGKITLGLSDYSPRASVRSTQLEALRLKSVMKRHGRSVRVLENKLPALSTATSHHAQLSEKKNHIELIKFEKDYYLVIGVQNITSYAHRDQARPARDARVGMLPPKLAQILINLCGPLEKNSIVLDPFCGTGVVLQEAILMGYSVLGTDLEPRMIDYTRKNLDWLISQISTKPFTPKNASKTPTTPGSFSPSDAKTTKPLTNNPACAIMDLCVGDATDFAWSKILKKPHEIGAVACETYLGPPMSLVPPDIKLKTAKADCRAIILGFLKNISSQLTSGTPLALAIPAWLRSDGSYSRLDILDEIKDMGYNVVKLKNSGNFPLLYHREGQIVARELIILRKK